MNGFGWPSAVPFIIQIKNIYKKKRQICFQGNPFYYINNNLGIKSKNVPTN